MVLHITRFVSMDPKDSVIMRLTCTCLSYDDITCDSTEYLHCKHILWKISKIITALSPNQLLIKSAEFQIFAKHIPCTQHKN